ncbi:Major Facilitator Superfamily protein [Friedmanniella luteola]|uniref:Major Facilitator Superfamily protein n=1 Tax=Friedmanniella luteola TaxID=546871 RepID=A0A1H1UL13_9ACTN|nr:MFS transporter [Friedmanniella luteola]SDS72906.1 Major Facilitator Superfamily protein [Friedmanniella luteola]
MYLADVTRSAGLRGGSLRRVAAGNVVALGLVSLLTDVSSEMVTAVLPAYLVLGLHLSVAQYGALDGLYTGATALTRLAGGHLADRFRRRKLVALVGYGLSAVSKLGLLGASGALGIGAVIAADRTGKGLRTAPRDALIAGSVAERDLGQAFGVHRAMDAVGAFLGPVAALALLALAGTGDYSVVFVGSLCAGLLGLVVLVLFVREPAAVQADPAPGAEPVLSAPGRVRARELLHAGAFRRLCVVAALLGLVTVGDGFVYLVLQDRDDLPVRVFPLLAVGTSLAFLLLAVPLGRLADRVGRWPVVVGGYGCLLGVYLLLSTDAGPLWLVLALYGAFYAATDGVLSALAVPLIPEALRTTGLALLQTGQALAYVVSSVVFGLLWQNAGVAVACLTAAAVAVLLLPCCALLLHRPGRVR